MTHLKVTIDREEGSISVWNNGHGIPVEMHEKERVYIPELIFGHLLTSSNYDDNEAKVTGGRNGYGAKLANIYSTEFTVETADAKNQCKYKQVFTNNMHDKGKPKITQHKKAEEYTCITFKPDLKLFGMESIDDHMEALMLKRVYDMAGTVKGIKVTLNGELLKIKISSNTSKCTSLPSTSLEVRPTAPRMLERYARWRCSQAAIIYESVADKGRTWEWRSLYPTASSARSLSSTTLPPSKGVSTSTTSLIRSSTDSSSKSRRTRRPAKSCQTRFDSSSGCS